MMTVFGILLVPIILTLTIAAYIVKKGVLAFAAAGFWFIFAIFSFAQSVINWDIYFCVAFISIGMFLTCVFSPLAWRETTAEGDRVEDPDERALMQELQQAKRETSLYSMMRTEKRPRRNGLIEQAYREAERGKR